MKQKKTGMTLILLFTVLSMCPGIFTYGIKRVEKVFITEKQTLGDSEIFIGIAKHHKLGEIVGQPTAAVHGMLNSFTLPGGYRVSWTGMRVLKQDRSPFFLKGIAPTVPVQRTIKGVKQGRDEFLEKAIEIINRD